MALHARDETMRLHGVHPDQQRKSVPQNEFRMPGGRTGSKPS